MGLFDQIKSFFLPEPPPPLPPAPMNPAQIAAATGAPVMANFQMPQEAPIILISGQSKDSKSVAAAVAMVRAQGGEPRIVTEHGGRNAMQDMKGVSGILLLGNDTDIDPAEYGQAKHPKTKSEAEVGDKPETFTQRQARTAYEKELLAVALDRRTPILGICGGMQRLNVLLGGDLYQHIPDFLGNDSHAQTEAPWVPVQPVTLIPGTRLGQMGKEIQVQHQMVPAPGAFDANMPSVMENSFHHQAVDRLGVGLRPSALYSETFTDPATGESKRLVAAYEPDPNGPLAGHSITGVQWHPEFGASPLGPKIFNDFVSAARERSQQPEISWAQRMQPQIPLRDRPPVPLPGSLARPGTMQSNVRTL